MALSVFGEEVALGDGDVAEKIAEGEATGGVGPVEFVRRDAAGDAEGAFADVGEVLEEGLDGGDFHGGVSLAAGRQGGKEVRKKWRVASTEKERFIAQKACDGAEFLTARTAFGMTGLVDALE